MIRPALKRRTRLQSGGPLRKRRKTRKGQVPEAVLDALWSKRVKERDNHVCQVGLVWALYGDKVVGECAGPLNAMHLYSRRYRAIRWDLDNGVTGCVKHHRLAHDNPVLAGRCYEEMRGRRLLDTLWIKAQAGGKVDRRAVKSYLEGKS